MEPTAEQIRAARALLNWSGPDLAKGVGVSLSTIRRLEEGRSARPVLVRAIRAVLEDAGIEFVPGGATLRSRRCRT